jgi:hypothetical protein
MYCKIINSVSREPVGEIKLNKKLGYKRGSRTKSNHCVEYSSEFPEVRRESLILNRFNNGLAQEPKKYCNP